MNKASKFRKPTKDEEIGAWRDLAWHLNLHRTLTMDPRQVEAALARMDHYVASHGNGNGTKPDPEVNQNVWAAFWTHIAGTPELGMRK